MKLLIQDQLRKHKQIGRKSFAVLLDPDSINFKTLPQLLTQSVQHEVAYFFVGGSLITNYATDELIVAIRKYTNIPVVLFPGSSLHVDSNADAILFLSLISGRNPDLLIGQQVVAAPLIKRSRLEVLPTGYILVESGRATTASYISNSMPIPHDKPSIAACTAMAGEMLGLQFMYLDAGSGAQKPVSAAMIAAVRQAVDTPVIVGGGINNGQKAIAALEAGADVIVVGNGIEENPDLLPEIAQAVRAFNERIAA